MHAQKNDDMFMYINKNSLNKILNEKNTEWNCNYTTKISNTRNEIDIERYIHT